MIYDLCLSSLGVSEATAGPVLLTLAAASATFFAAVVTHPLQWYRSRLQAATHKRSRHPPGSIFDGLSIKLVHTVLSNTLMYLSKEQLTEFVLSEFEK